MPSKGLPAKALPEVTKQSAVRASALKRKPTSPQKLARAKQNPINDLDLSLWRDYDHIETGSLWQIDARERENGHSYDYHGNCVPQILTQLLLRYTRSCDTLLDLFAGSGTSLIEAANLGRKALGVELQPEMVRKVNQKLKTQGKHAHARVIQGNSADAAALKPKLDKALVALNANQANQQADHVGHAQNLADFLFLHPPYADIIKFSDDPSCLSNAKGTQGFLDQFLAVAQLGHTVLKPGRYAAVVIGDQYTAGELVPLGFYCMQAMQQAGFKLKAIVVKNITGNEVGKGKQANLWRYRALAGGFYLFAHEYVLVFEKPVRPF